MCLQHYAAGNKCKTPSSFPGPVFSLSRGWEKQTLETRLSKYFLSLCFRSFFLLSFLSSFHLSPVSFFPSFICLLFLICFLFLVSCFLCHVSGVLCLVSCVLFLVHCALCPVSCVLCLVSCVSCPVSCALCLVSGVLCAVSCVLCLTQCLMSCM